MAPRRGRKLAGKAPERGQSLVELALMMPLLALLLVGTVDLGRIFFAYARLTNAVKEGALFGINFPTHITAGDSADPNNVVFHVKRESVNTAGVPDSSLVITVTASSSSDVRCYEGRSSNLKAVSGSLFLGDCGKAVSGDSIEVRAQYDFYPITTQLMGILGNGPFKLSKSVRMVIQ